MRSLNALTLCAASGAALAHGRPGEMRAIDARLAPKPALSAAETSKVQALRADGEPLHKEGKHADSMKALGEAKKIIGL
jgi:hypothetical protein